MGRVFAAIFFACLETPVVTIPEADMLVLEETEVTMRCEANGIPSPRLTWMREGRTIVTGRKYDITVSWYETRNPMMGLMVCVLGRCFDVKNNFSLLSIS